MKRTMGNVFWGLILILAGGFFLAVNLGALPDFSENGWSLIFAAASVLFFIGYFFSGIANWGLLFPAVGSGAIALTIWLSGRETADNVVGGLFMLLMSIPFWVAYLVHAKNNWWALIPGWALGAIGAIILLAGRGADNLIGTLIMWAIALPFFVVYFKNRTNWWALIPGFALGVIGAIILLSEIFSGALIGSMVLFAIGVPFFVVYFNDRQRWWALIPAYTMTVLAAIILFENVVSGEVIGALVMFAIALPFFFVYARNRENWWALIPAFVTGMIGFIILFENLFSGELVGTLVLLAVATPFFVLYMLKPENWWAVIPGGILVSAALTTLLSTVSMAEAAQVRLLGGTMFAGIGATFGFLWLRQGKLDTEWAKYPALGFAGATALVVVFGPRVEMVWSLLLIGGGLWLLLKSPRPKEKM